MEIRSIIVLVVVSFLISHSVFAYEELSESQPQIVFSSDDGGPTNIHIMNPDGSNVRRLESHPEENLSPACSPDGKRIAFTNIFIGDRQIEVMDADGSNRIALTDQTSYSSQPVWSPDGTQIAFIANREGTLFNEGTELYVMNADGSNLTRVTDNDFSEVDPAWSPDGTRIAFRISRSLGLNSVTYENEFKSEIFTIKPDGSDITRITHSRFSDENPKWSPDGTKIAFDSTRYGSNHEIYSMNADGTNIVRLTDNSAYDVMPAWSPDGQQIAFVSDRDGDEQVAIYIMNADGSNVQRLTDPSTDSWSPCWLVTPTLMPAQDDKSRNNAILRLKIVTDLFELFTGYLNRH